MPVAAIAGETGGLDRKDGADAPFADRRQQALEAGACDPAARAAEIIIDDLDSGPAELLGAFGEPVLPTPALVIVHQLIGGWLAGGRGRPLGKKVSSCFWPCPFPPFSTPSPSPPTGDAPDPPQR